MSYKDSGVDVQKAEKLVEWMKSKSEASPRVFSGIGGFGSAFDISFPDMKNPYLVSCVDGVGTKLKWAFEFQKEFDVAKDLVAMCVNDLLCLGAKPLFFLDYYACGNLDVDQTKRFFEGLKKACKEAQCDLIGGETAEMPGFYPKGEFDCAGFAAGVVEKEKILPFRDEIQKEDVLIAIQSSGFHSNGYSLLREHFSKDKLFSKKLLSPTHIYVEVIQNVLKKHKPKGIAHITGGGMDNLLRILPKGAKVHLKPWSWEDLFLEVKKKLNLNFHEMLKTFNCGAGMVLIVKKEDEEGLIQTVQGFGYKSWRLGVLKDINPQEDSSWSYKDDG